MALCKKGGFGVPRCSAAVAAAAASSSFPEASLAAAAAGQLLRFKKGGSLLSGVHHRSAVTGRGRSGVVTRDSPPCRRRVALSKRLLGSLSADHVLYGGKHVCGGKQLFSVKPRYFHACVSNASSSLSATANTIPSKKRGEGDDNKETSSRACSPSSSLSTTSSESSQVSSPAPFSESSSSGSISSTTSRRSDSSRRARSSGSISSESRTSNKSSSSSGSGSSSQTLVLHPLLPNRNAACLYGKGSGGLRQQQQHLLYNSFTGGRRSLIYHQQQLRGFAFPSLRFFANSGGLSSSSSLSSENPAGRPSASGYSDSNVSLQQLRVLQQQAEAHLEDSQLQQRYLAALNAHGESYRAVQHVEKHKDNFPGMSEAVLVEYVKALCSSGLIHQQGRSLSQVLQRYVGEGTEGGANESNFKGGEGVGGRDLSSSSSLSSLLQQHQTQQQQLMQQQLMVQLQQLVHQLQMEGAQQRTRTGDAAARTAGAAAAASEAEMLKLANVGTGIAAGRFAAASAAAPLTGWRRYNPLRAIRWFCRALWGLLKACNRGLWGLLLSPVIAVFLFWSFLNDGVHAVQNSVKNMEGSGGMGNQSGGKKANDWVAGKVVKPEEVNTTFADVKGCEEVKKEVVEVVEYLKAPAKFTAMGARLPKGVLLQGPPGTGKTLLARAIAGEAGVPFIHASGSDFEEMYVGVGASRLRQLFAEARKRSPCILFIDEIDALGGRRTLTENKHHRQTLNQLLTELDGFKPSDGVTLICATNLAEALDPALTRPGRIDRIIHVPLPCKKERIDILQHYAVKMPLAEDVDLDLLASLTSGMTGADLANLLNFAAIRAATEGKAQVTLAEVEESFDRLMVGNRRSSVVMKEEERKVTAYHESGHALMCLYTPGSLPLHKATILFRGSALGVTWSVNREESFSKSQKEYLASLDVAMGGKAAEEIVFGKGNVTSGCSNDLQKATRVARNMVTGFGMGVEDSKAPMVVSGKEYSFLSDESKKKVDEAVQRLLDQSYERARVLLTEKREELERLAQALLEHETLTADEIRAAVAGTIDSAAIKERRRQQKAAGAQTLKPKPKPKKKSGGNEGEGEEEQQPPSALLRSAGGRPLSASAATSRGGEEQQQQRSASLHYSSGGGGSPPPSASSAALSREQEDTGRSQERVVLSQAAAERKEEDKFKGAAASSSSSVQPTSNDGTQKATELLAEKVTDFSAAGGTLGDSKAVVCGGDSKAVDYGGDSKTVARRGDSKTAACGGDSKTVCGGEPTGSGGGGSQGASFAAAGSSHPYSVAATTPTVSAVSALLAAAVHEPRAEQRREEQQRPQRTSGAEEHSVAAGRTENAETRDEKTGTMDGKDSYTKEFSGGEAAHVDSVSAGSQCDKADVESKLSAHEDEDIRKHSKQPSAHAGESATSEEKKQAENSGRDQGGSGGRV